MSPVYSVPVGRLPSNAFISVVFPHPDGPDSVVMVPCSAVKDTGARICSPGGVAVVTLNDVTETADVIVSLAVRPGR